MEGNDVRILLAKNIKYLRDVRKMSQADLAEAADISIPFLSDIERCNKWPHPDTLAKIADSLGVGIAELFYDPNTETQTDTMLATNVIHEILVSQQNAVTAVCEKYFGKSNET